MASLSWVYLKYTSHYYLFEFWYILAKLLVVAIPAVFIELEVNPQWHACCMATIPMFGIILLMKKDPFASEESKQKPRGASSAQPQATLRCTHLTPMTKLAIISQVCHVL
jgi:hypothetical protein